MAYKWGGDPITTYDTWDEQSDQTETSEHRTEKNRRASTSKQKIIRDNTLQKRKKHLAEILRHPFPNVQKEIPAFTVLEHGTKLERTPGLSEVWFFCIGQEKTTT